MIGCHTAWLNPATEWVVNCLWRVSKQICLSHTGTLTRKWMSRGYFLQSFGKTRWRFRKSSLLVRGFNCRFLTAKIWHWLCLNDLPYNSFTVLAEVKALLIRSRFCCALILLSVWCICGVISAIDVVGIRFFVSTRLSLTALLILDWAVGKIFGGLWLL